MKKLASISLLVAVPLALLWWVAHVVDAGLRKAKLPYSAINDVFNGNASADVLVCGSSRAAVHVSPRILDSVLGLASHNIGMSGWGFHMQYTMFKVYLRNNKKPRYILQTIDPMLLTDRPDFYEYELFLPYANDPLIMNATKRYQGCFTIPELYFPLFKYNNHLGLVKKGFKLYYGIGKDNTPSAYKGYWPNDAQWDGTFEQYKKANPGKPVFKQDTAVQREFEEFLSYCAANNIQVIMVYTPTYYEQQQMTGNLAEIKNSYRAYADKYKIPMLDYSGDSLCYNKKYFYNSQHLNKMGAEIFSNKLAADLKANIIR